MIPRDDVIRMAREAGFEYAEYGSSCTPGMYAYNMKIVELFAALVEARATERKTVIGTRTYAGENGLIFNEPMTSQDVQDMASQLKVEKERAARIAAQTEVAEMKERIARSGIDQRQAVLAEREACRTECQNLADILREHNDISGAELAESLAEAIAARGAA